MTNNNSEFINFNINAGNGRKNKNYKNLTLKKLYAWIEEKKLEVKITEELKRMCSKYPHQALENWQMNYSKHLSQARKNVRSKNKNTNLPMTEEEFLDKNSSEEVENFDEFN